MSLLAGCANQAAIDSVAIDLKAAEPEFVDEGGLHWELSQEHVQFAGSQPATTTIYVGEPAQVGFDAMPEDEIASKLRPRMLLGENEYLLSADQSVELAQRIKAAVGSSEEQSAAAELPTSGSATLAPPLEARFAHDVIDSDSRYIVEGSADWPYSMIATMRGRNLCTASKIFNHQTAITAAHCVHDGINWREQPTLAFGDGAGAPWGTVDPACYVITIPDGWDGSKPQAYDFAIITLHGRGAHCNLENYDTGYFGYRTVKDCTSEIALNLDGYPGKNDKEGDAPGGEWTYPTLFGAHDTSAYTSCGGYPATLWFNLDASGGQSGAVLFSSSDDFSNHEVRGIYKGGYDSLFDHENRGRRMDDGLVEFIKAVGGI